MGMGFGDAEVGLYRLELPQVLPAAAAAAAAEEEALLPGVMS